MIVKFILLLSCAIFQSSRGNIIRPSSEKQKTDFFGAPNITFQDDTGNNCEDYKDQGFQCVPYYQCSNGKVVIDQSDLTYLQFRNLDDQSELSNVILDPKISKCPGNIEICCQLPTDSGSASISTRSQLKIVKSQYKSQCGRRNENGVSFNINFPGSNSSGLSQFGEWPHVCAIISHTEVDGHFLNEYVCGCSLIADRVVLTSAHCVNGLEKTSLKVRAGEWDTQHTNEPHEHQDRLVKHVSIHPMFEQKTLCNDFALLHLEESFILAPHIDTVCLPDATFSRNSFDAKKCFASGWGKDKFGQSGHYQVIMKEIELDIVEKEECESHYRQTRLGENFTLDKSFICAGGKLDVDTCKGDGGSPLVCPQEGRDGQISYIQAGIVAWGIGCGSETPGVYANVSDAVCYIDWATRCIEGLDSNFYGYIGCENWATEEYCKINASLSITQQQSDQNSSEESDERLRIKLKNHQSKLEDAMRSCVGVKIDINCSDFALKKSLQVLKDENSTNVVPRTVDIEELAK